MTSLAQAVNRRLILGVAAVNVFVWALAAVALNQSHRQYEAAAQVSTQNLARSLSATVTGVLGRIDVGLGSIAMQIEEQLARGRISTPDLNRHLAEHKRHLYEFEDIWVADAEGNINWGTQLRQGKTTNIADRDYFRQLKASSSAELIISKPVIGRITQAWSMLIARRVDNPDGSFGGVVLGSLRVLDYFNALFASFELGPRGVIAVRAKDLDLYTEYMKEAGARPPGNWSALASTRRAVGRDPISGSYVEAHDVDGIGRNYSYQKIQRYPLYVFVGQDRAAMMLPWERELATTLGLLLVFALASFAYIRTSCRRTTSMFQIREADQEQIQRERGRLQLVLDCAPIGMAFVADKIVRFTNPAMAKMFGVEPGDNALDFYVNPADRLAIEARLSEGRPLSNQEIRTYDKEGRQRDMLVTFLPMNYAGEGGVLSWALDITDVKQSELAMRASQQQLRTLVDSIDASVFMKDGEGRYVLTNAYHDRVWPDYRGGLGLRNVDFMPIEQAEASARTDQAVLETGQRQSYEAAVTGQDGTARCFQVTKVPILDAAGQIVGLCGVAFDITARKDAERTIERIKDEAMAATRAKSEFLANMSHEIRTPLNAVIGMTHLALRTSLDVKQRNYIEKAHVAANNLLGIINDILDFSKIEAGRLELEEVAFDLESVMGELSALLSIRAEEKGLELVFSMAPQVPTSLVGDPLRLGQVLLNLCNNAIKFTNHGEVVVGVECCTREAENVELHFWVRDTGIGMTVEQRQRLFQSFSQADSSTTRKYGGTGLGLAISKDLVGLMKGSIWVESSAGAGSVFHFRARFAGASAGPRAASLPVDRLQGLRVLVVDDNDSTRRALASIAEGSGLHVHEAQDSASALAAAREQPVDVVLVDLKLPGMGGIECASQLQQGRRDPLPVIVMAPAFRIEEAVQAARARQIPLSTVIAKPITPSSLLEAIGRAVGRLAPAATTQRVPAGPQPGIRQALGGARLLLAEDNALNQELAVALLEEVGIEVVTVQNGQQALETLMRAGHFDGVLMDCQMPVMDGYTAAREIRKQAAWVLLPIIAMTANVMAGDRERILAAGMNDHIAKPLSVERMFETLSRWIRPESPLRAPPREVAPPPHETTDRETGMSLPGIDEQAGLRACGRNHQLYQQIIAVFSRQQQDFEARFAEARKDRDPAVAIRTAHSLRGSAGSIGAIAVERAAATLEQLCTAGAAAEAIDHQLATLMDCLDPVLEGIHSATAARS